MIRGDTRLIHLEVINPYDGSTVTTAGARFWFTGKRSASDSDADAIFQKTETNGITIVSNGLVDVLLQPYDTTSLEAGFNSTLFYDAQVLTTSGELLTFQSGPLIVLAESTRAAT